MLRLQIIKTSSFCLLNLLGLVKCLAEFLLRLSVKTGKTTAEKMTAKPSANIVFNALAPMIIKTRTPQVFGDFGRFPASTNAFLGFNWNNSQSLPNFEQHFCNPSFDSGVVICIFSFPPFCCGWNFKWMISTALDLLMQQVWNV